MVETLIAREFLEPAGAPLFQNFSHNTLLHFHNLVTLQSAESTKQITATALLHKASFPTALENIGGRQEHHSKNVKNKTPNDLNPIVAIDTDAYANKFLPHVAIPVQYIAEQQE